VPKQPTPAAVTSSAAVTAVGNPGEGSPVRALQRALSEVGVTVEEGPAARCDVVVFERIEPDVLQLVQSIAREGRRIVVVHVGEPVLSAVDSLRLLESGASDAVEWHSAEEVAANLRARIDRWIAIDDLVDSARVATQLVGRSPRWVAVVRDLVEIARFSSTAILISGESGTGKELAARLVHELDARDQKRDLVLVDCTTIVPTLSGSEFFGHEKGAFTGATGSRDGAVALAHHGTLFLDEVGELPLSLQPELLRVVQEGAYKRVGSNTWRRTLFRLVCATNRDLLTEVSEGRFRHDLYNRIAAWQCNLPSLRERREDIPLLAMHFLASENRGELELSSAVVEYLMERDYPGNVRELRHVITRLVHRHVGDGPITLADLPEDELSLATRQLQGVTRTVYADLTERLRDAVRAQLDAGRSMRQIVAATRHAALDEALEDERGNVTRAASRLGMSRRAVQLSRSRSEEDPTDV